MPVYEYECGAGHGFERVYPVAECSKRRKCPQCGKWGRRVISSPRMVQPDIEPFMDTTGKMIGSRYQWSEELKRNDSIELGHSDIAWQTEQRKKNAGNRWKDPERKQRIIDEFNARGI